MAKNRNYSCKDVDMLMASKTIAESFKINLPELSATRTDWTEQYANQLINQIDQAIETHLGIDAKKELRNATSTLATIQAPARRDLSYLKTQLDDDFKKEPVLRDEILKTLGFAKHLREVQKGSQQSLIQLLFQFKTNLTPALRQAITDKGINAVLLDNIITYADTFKQANATQESLKTSTKAITREVADVFNAIYDEIIGICKKASNYYQYEPLKKEQFTFAKALANLGVAAKVPSTDPIPV